MSNQHGLPQLSDASIRIDNMPPEGRDLALVVDREEREAIAAHLAVTAVERLIVRLKAVRFRGGIRVAGRLEALVVQPSVVSLEPVTQEIAEPVDRVFLPAGDKRFAGPANAEVFVDLEGEDLPDHFEGNEADLSGLVVETLALAIDPYPRAEGESLSETGDDDDGSDLPFAGLAALKTPKDGS